jgi:hypothetical protein
MIIPTVRSRLMTHVKQRLHVLLLGCLALLLIACGGTPTSSPAKKPLPTATPVPPGQLLFQADWSHGLAGWQASAGWKIVDGNLQSDASPALSLTIPYQPATSRYAVEYGVQVISVPKQGGYFKLVADGAPGKDGYHAFVNELRPSASQIFSIHPTQSVTIDPVSDQDAMQQISDYEPGNQLRTYRVEVRGATVEFYIDGQRRSTASSSQTPVLSTGPLRLLCSGAVIRVSILRITTI